MLAVEAATAVSRSVLRPDLYPDNDNAAHDLDEIDVARGKIYLLLANLLREPPSDLILTELQALEAEGDALEGALAGLGKAAQLADAGAVVREHFALFVGVGRAELVPYASYYRTGFLYERPLVNVREDIRVIGIARAGEGNEPEDSISFLCEAMAGMVLGKFEAAPEFQRRFFMRHLENWAEAFFADLEKAEGATLYQAVGRLGRIFIALEREAFAIEESDTAGELRRA